MQHNHRMELFACDASKDFACRVIEELNKIQREDFEGPYHIGDMTVARFSDGEFQPQYDESVRGASVYIIQSTIPPADNLMELLLAIRL